MSLHENKECPRCFKQFECKPGNITQCHCFFINISSDELQFIKQVSDDCLCKECLLELKKEFKELKEPT